MAIIEKPTNLINVANTLGYYEYKPHPVTGVNKRYVNLGRLCTHPNINKWAKYKPVRHSSKIELTPYQLEATNYGIQLPTYSDVDDLYEGLKLPFPGAPDRRPVWSYLKPRGVASEPFRVGDFNLYDSRAMIPFGVFNVTSRASKEGGSSLITGSIGTVEGSPTQLGWSDLVKSGRRLGMGFRKSINDPWSTVIAPVGELSVTLDVNNPNLTVGSYSALLFLTNSVGGATQIVGFENYPSQGFSFSVVTNTVTISIEARWDLFETNKLNIKVMANNSTGGNVSLPLSSLSVRMAHNECDDPFENHEQLLFTGDLVAPAGNNIILERNPIINRGESPMWKICWRNAGLYPSEFSANIIQQT